MKLFFYITQTVLTFSFGYWIGVFIERARWQRHESEYYREWQERNKQTRKE